jgi:hypothetical protein
MEITKKSTITGKVHTMNLNVTQEQLDCWQRGTLIQTAIPQLRPDEREFLISGITPEEWKETFGKYEND